MVGRWPTGILMLFTFGGLGLIWLFDLAWIALGRFKDKNGNIQTVFCEYIGDTKSGTPGADSIKVKGNIHWVSVKHGIKATINLYDRLFKEKQPGKVNSSYLDDINPESKKNITVFLEENCANSSPMDQFQFERHGYFICDTKSTNQSIVFNRTVTLRDTWK